MSKDKKDADIASKPILTSSQVPDGQRSEQPSPPSEAGYSALITNTVVKDSKSSRMKAIPVNKEESVSDSDSNAKRDRELNEATIRSRDIVHCTVHGCSRGNKPM